MAQLVYSFALQAEAKTSPYSDCRVHYERSFCCKTEGITWFEPIDASRPEQKVLSGWLIGAEKLWRAWADDMLGAC